MDSRPKILLSFPNKGWLRVEVAMWLSALSNDTRCRIALVQPNNPLSQQTPYENTLNGLAKVFRESDCDYWMSMDDDNPPIRSPLDYVERDLDFLAFPTPLKKRVDGRNMLLWSVQRDGGQYSSLPGVGLEQCESVNTGCFLVARRVVEAVKAPFLRQYDDDGCVVEGNDIAACRRFREAGFKVWAAWDNMCSHYKETDLVQLIPTEANYAPARN